MAASRKPRQQSGYVYCACRDCFEIAIADSSNPQPFCHECEEAGCELDSECQCASAYGCDAEEGTV